MKGCSDSIAQNSLRGEANRRLACAPITPTAFFDDACELLMMKIRQAQFDALQDARSNKSAEAITTWLMDEFPVTPAEKPEIYAQVQAISRQARSWGITSGTLVATHVYASVVLGTDYYEAFAPAGQVLSDPALSDELKEAWLTGWLDIVKTHLDKNGKRA
jgi:hypothetical protein